MTSINEPPLILHIVFRFDVGGLENGIVNLINRLPPERWRHGIVALDSVSSAFLARVQRKDVFSMQLCKGPGHAVPLYPELFRLCRRLRPTIVHTRNLAALEACVPAWAAGVPVRIHGEHGRDLDDLDGSNRKNQLVRRCYRPFVHHYVTMSQDLQRYLGSRVGVPSQRISQIYNGVDTKLFGLCGKTRPRIRGCPFVDGVRHLAWLPGERTDIPQILGALDCFVLPSLAEGISNTLLEASASGLPVVATQVGGNPEIVEDGVTGHLVAAGSPSALTDAMLRYLHAPETARQHGLAGRRVVEQRFSLERMMRD
jgi:glycosyltransferase involved in cell wall biosynthesis